MNVSKKIKVKHKYRKQTRIKETTNANTFTSIRIKTRVNPILIGKQSMGFILLGQI